MGNGCCSQFFRHCQKAVFLPYDWDARFAPEEILIRKEYFMKKLLLALLHYGKPKASAGGGKTSDDDFMEISLP